MANDDEDFYATIPVFDNFADAVKPTSYRPLPADWMIGFSDVVGSTKAIAQGRYKAVNMAGAGVIASVANALARRPFAYVFGGDGASFAVSAADAPLAAEALKAMAVFAREELQMELRVAMISVAEARAAGRDIRVARFAASPHCAYAMFAGGGLSWFEGEAKRGACALPPGAAGARPDLSGLSCRWTIAPAAHGLIMSVIVVARGDDARFSPLVEEIVAMALGATDGGRPITLASLDARWPSEALSLETATTTAPSRSRLKARLAATLKYLYVTSFYKLKLRTKNFDSSTYFNDVAANADFRKFDDGLRLTLDCSPDFADALEKRLQAADEFAAYGAFRQGNALMTCFVPSISDRGHVHFVDGADGGYAMAALAMKARLGK